MTAGFETSDMPPIEHDVFVCCRDGAGRDLGNLIAQSLSARGFHVILTDRAPGGAPDPARLRVIEQTPDFILVLTPGVLARDGAEGDAVRAEVTHAIRHRSALLTVAAPGFTGFATDDLNAELAPIVASHRIVYNPARSAESLELMSHALSSDVSVDDRRLWRWGQRGFMLVGLAFLLVVANEVVPRVYQYWTRPVDKPSIPPFALYWTAYGQRPEGGRIRDVEIGDTAQLMPGDRFRIQFSPSAGGYAYVIVRNSRGELTVLFPAATMRGASGVRPGTIYDAPAAPGWFTVDPSAGIEAIYIVAGYDPLENLEELVEDGEAELSVAARRDLVDSTVLGLLDGRHGTVPSKTWTRNRDPIVRSLPIPPGPATGSTTLVDGTMAQHRMLRQAGVLSVSVELKLRFQPGAMR